MRLFLLGFWGLICFADISGTVVDSGGSPVVGATVSIPTSTERVLTNALGQFVLPCSGSHSLKVGAGLTYDPHASENFLTTTIEVDCGDSGIIIQLEEYPTNEDPTYEPIKASSPGGCSDCHSLQYDEWIQSRHSGSAVNTWVLDIFADFKASHDASNTGNCATCHSPAAEAQNPGTIFLDDMSLSTSALEGVHCSGCHQIDFVDPTQISKLHLLGNTSMRFPCGQPGCFDTHEFVWGPLPDVGFPFMKAGYQPQYQESVFCASCHEYENEIGVPAQTTYSEWQASPFAIPGSGFQSCQDCHMPASPDPMKISDVITSPVRPAGVHKSHLIEGTSLAKLQSAISLNGNFDQDEQVLNISVDVANIGAGHKFPTGISLRNIILRIEVWNDQGTINQTSGPVLPSFASDNNGIPETGDWAGEPGVLFGKRLAGRVNGQGVEVEPVLFVDAERISYELRIDPQDMHSSDYGFLLDESNCDGGLIHIKASLVFRRIWRAIAVEKGWTEDAWGEPWEFPIHSWETSFTPEAGVAVAGAEDPICFGDSVTLTANSYCLEPPLAFAWSGPSIQGDPSLSSVTVAPVQMENYQVTVTGQNGSRTGQAIVHVLPPANWADLLSQWSFTPTNIEYDLNGNGVLDIAELVSFLKCQP